MAANNPITAAERRRIKKLHAEGATRNDIAKALKRSASTITKVCGDLGLSFDRAATKAATEAKVADAKAKRAQLMVELLDKSERLLDQLFTPATIHSFGGKDNTYNSKRVDQPLFKDQRDIMGSVSLALNASMRLDHHDTDGGAEGARSMVTALFDGLQIAYDKLTDEEAPADDARD